jgi:hypothetical protein
MMQEYTPPSAGPAAKRPAPQAPRSTAPTAGRKISTGALAAKFHAEPQTPRASFCRHGHWMGIVPTKLPNGRLLWDEAEADALLSGLPVKADAAKIDEHFARKAAAASKLPEHIARKVAAKIKRLAALTAGEVA